MRALLPCLALLVLASGAAAHEEPHRLPTPEERRMMTLQLGAAGFTPCTAVSLVDSRWSCTARDAAGRNWQLRLSNLDFSVLARRAVE